MEGIAVKVLVVILKALISIPFIIGLWVFGTFKDEYELQDWFHDNGVDHIMDFLSFGYLTLFAAIKFSFVNIDIHAIFDGVFFYVGGIGSIVWLIFKLKLAWMDFKIKKDLIEKIKKEKAKDI